MMAWRMTDRSSTCLNGTWLSYAWRSLIIIISCIMSCVYKHVEWLFHAPEALVHHIRVDSTHFGMGTTQMCCTEALYWSNACHVLICLPTFACGHFVESCSSCLKFDTHRMSRFQNTLAKICDNLFGNYTKWIGKTVYIFFFSFDPREVAETTRILPRGQKNCLDFWMPKVKLLKTYHKQNRKIVSMQPTRLFSTGHTFYSAKMNA